ncbi:MAG: hypothetical protein M3R06_04635, partial [Chloroflexota bacterium]|nr:hypothetical protein [Chloroflexota bacterium]
AARQRLHSRQSSRAAGPGGDSHADPPTAAEQPNAEADLNAADKPAGRKAPATKTKAKTAPPPARPRRRAASPS